MDSINVPALFAYGRGPRLAAREAKEGSPFPRPGVRRFRRALHITHDAAMRRVWHKHAGGYERTKEVTNHSHHNKV
jgi:hypothetical protein